LKNIGIKNQDELLRRIAANEEGAFATLFHHYKHFVFTIARAYTENQVRSEEIVQDVFLRVWKNRQNLPKIENLEAWICRIARNRSFSVLRIMARDRQFMSAEYNYLPPQAEPSGRISEMEDVNRLLREGLQLLTPKQRRIFELSRLEGHPREDIARELGIAKATVSVHLTVAIRTMRSFLLSRLEFLALLPLLEKYF